MIKYNAKSKTRMAAGAFRRNIRNMDSAYCRERLESVLRIGQKCPGWVTLMFEHLPGESTIELDQIPDDFIITIPPQMLQRTSP